MKETITIILKAAALILSTSIIRMSIVHAQNETQLKPNTQGQGFAIPPPGPNFAVPVPPTMPLPPGIGPPPTPEQLANSSKIPDNLFQICTAMTIGKPVPKFVFSANSKKIPAPYGTQLPLCSLFPQFREQSQTIFPQSLPPPGSTPEGLPPSLIPPPLIPPSQLMLKLLNPPPPSLPAGVISFIQLPPGIPPPFSPAILRQLEASSRYLDAMQKEINTRLGNDTSTAHLAQVLKQMTAEGKITCHPPFTTEVGCNFSPPSSLYQPVPGGPTVSIPIITRNLTK